MLLGICGSEGIGTDLIITRYMRGVFQSPPTCARYPQVWDVSLVLKMINALGVNEQITLKELTLKLTVLLALTTAQRLVSPIVKH